MKLKLEEIVEMGPALQQLLLLSLPPKISFRVARLAQQINPILKTCEDQRNNLIKKHGTQTGEDYTVPPEHIPAFRRDIQELLSVEEEVNVETFKLDELGTNNVTGKMLLDLRKLILES